MNYRNIGSGLSVPLLATDGGDFNAVESGQWVYAPASICSFQAILSNTTTPSATVEIHGTNTNTVTPGTGTLLGTITLTGASDHQSFTKNMAAYSYKCAKVTAIAGASASVAVKMGF